MNPLEIDQVVTRILTFVRHPADLQASRLVNQYWNSMATAVLNGRGTTVVVSDENYLDFFGNRATHIAGLNLTLNLSGHVDGRSRALLVMIKMLREDKAVTGTGSYCVKAIKYCSGVNNPNDYLDETLFWQLVDIAAPDLEQLFVAGALNPPPGQPKKFKSIPALPERGTQFPALTSVTFDVRRQNRQQFIPRKLAQILNNAPRMEYYKLIADPAGRQAACTSLLHKWTRPTTPTPTPKLSPRSTQAEMLKSMC